MIRTTKKTFELVPEGERELLCTKVEIKPSVKHPELIIFTFKDTEKQSTLQVREDLSKDVACNILGAMCYIAGNGKYGEGDDVPESEVPDLFLNKVFIGKVKHNEDKKGNTYANLSYLKSLVVPETTAAPVGDDL